MTVYILKKLRNCISKASPVDEFQYGGQSASRRASQALLISFGSVGWVLFSLSHVVFSACAQSRYNACPDSRTSGIFSRVSVKRGNKLGDISCRRTSLFWLSPKVQLYFFASFCISRVPEGQPEKRIMGWNLAGEANRQPWSERMPRATNQTCEIHHVTLFTLVHLTVWLVVDSGPSLNEHGHTEKGFLKNIHKLAH